MKIAFVTTCLDPGRDGVGDYTRDLAMECARLGHETALLALRDPFADGRNDPRVLRLRDITTSADDVRAARDFLAAFAPRWVSLQFVCYGFHPRGLCWAASDRLAEIIGARPVHIMFHELWIGAARKAPWKDRIIGAIQRTCVMRLFARLNIRHTVTTNSAFVALLRGSGVHAGIIPLFGSVPSPRGPARMERIKSWRFLMFGTLHPIWPPEPLLTHLCALGVAVEIWHAGHIRTGMALWKRMVREGGDRLIFRKLGSMPAEELANVFADVDFGIATTPWEIVGKSASVAAMLEHGLPVIVNRDDIHYAGWRQEGYDPLLIRMGPDLPSQLSASRRLPFKSRREQTASRLVSELEAIES